MDIQIFARKSRLRLKRYEDGENIIPGKLGHIYEHDDATLGLMFMSDRPRLWANAKRKLKNAGFTIWQDGDDEGSALFDPANRTQVRLALKVVRARARRRLSPAQVAALEKARQARRIAQTRCAEVGVAG